MSTPPNLRSTTVRGAPAVVSPVSRRHRTRSDSIPEDRQANSNLLDDADRELEALLMRHSSPLVVIRPGSAGRTSSSSNSDAATGPGAGGGVTTATTTTAAAVASPVLLERRNSSPSPLRLNRPRSNPRNRTPMLYEDPQDGFGRDGDAPAVRRNEGRRITIRHGAGAAVGAHLAVANRFRTNGANERDCRVTSELPTKSRKQGPGKGKIRRSNNSNFINLAAEVNGSSSKAAQALLVGHANASKHRSLLDQDSHRSKAMEQFYASDEKERFFEGELPQRPYESFRRSHR